MSPTILVIGDDYIPSSFFVDAITRSGVGARIVVEDLGGSKEDQHHHQQTMEFHGPNSVSCPPHLIEAVADADFVCGHFAPFNRELIDAALNLKLIAVARAGLENVDIEAADARGIGVVPAIGRNASAVAELQIGLMLAEARNITHTHSSILNGGWRKEFPRIPVELRDSVIGMVGLGHVGRSFVAKMRGFGSEMLAYDPYLPADALSAEGITKVDDLLELCRRSDFVLIQARLSAETERFFSTEQFAAMKPSAFFINCARSRLVDTDALVHALTTGEIAGAGLDVFDDEPLPADSPFRTLDNVSMTTHLGGETVGTNITSADLVVRAIETYMADGSVSWASNAGHLGWA